MESLRKELEQKRDEEVAAVKKDAMK